MSTSQYFNYTHHTRKQDVVDKLVQQVIKCRGVNVQYCKRGVVDFDEISEEAIESVYDESVEMEAYIQDIQNFNGRGQMWGMGGQMYLEDNITLCLNITRVNEELGDGYIPQHGDLLYIAYADKLFEVDKRLEDDTFLQYGKNYVYNLRCTLYDNDHASLETELDEIDRLATEGLTEESTDETNEEAPTMLVEDKAINTEAKTAIDQDMDFGDKK